MHRPMMHSQMQSLITLHWFESMRLAWYVMAGFSTGINRAPAAWMNVLHKRYFCAFGST